MTMVTEQAPPQKPHIDYPCEFIFKVTGLVEQDFIGCVVRLLQPLDMSLSEEKIVVRPSRTGKYVGLTVPVHLTDEAALEEAWRLLKSEPRILWAL